MRPINVILSTLSVVALLAGSPVLAAGGIRQGNENLHEMQSLP